MALVLSAFACLLSAKQMDVLCVIWAYIVMDVSSAIALFHGLLFSCRPWLRSSNKEKVTYAKSNVRYQSGRQR